MRLLALSVATIATLSACSTRGSTPSGTIAVETTSSEASTGVLSSPTPGPAISIHSLEGRIVFSDETQDVWSMRADGTQINRLTSSPAQEFDPAWSPNGSRIAYRRQPGDDLTAEIYLMRSDGSARRALTHNDVPDWGPAFSPDGRAIAFNSGMRTEGFGLFGFAIGPDGSALRLLNHHFVEYPAWSADGTRIAFMAQEPGASGTNPDYNIFVMNADGSDVRRLTTTPGEDGWPAWSRDGASIVFASTRDDCSVSDASDCRSTGDIGPWSDVWIMNADGTNQRRVTSAFGQFFVWSPDGAEILVAGAGNMYVIRPDGTGATQLPVPGVAHPLFPDWVA